jgi:hypothetical protein
MRVCVCVCECMCACVLACVTVRAMPVCPCARVPVCPCARVPVCPCARVPVCPCTRVYPRVPACARVCSSARLPVCARLRIGSPRTLRPVTAFVGACVTSSFPTCITFSFCTVHSCASSARQTSLWQLNQVASFREALVPGVPVASPNAPL